MDPELFFRKLWHPAMVARWNACQLTSQHTHGEPPEWFALRQQGVANVNQYPLATHFGTGLALPSSRDRYHAICVQAGTAWAAVPLADQRIILEQAGVFAFRDPAHAYWYGGPATAADIFVVFYGVELSAGPEATSVITPVIKKVASLSTQDFIDQYCDGAQPAQPVDDLEIDHDPPPGGLVGDDEEEDDDGGDMPKLR